MNQKIDNKFDVLHKSFQSAGLAALKLKGGIRVKTESGGAIDIFSLTGNPDQVRARVKLNEPDPLKRQAYVESFYNTLSAALEGVARAEPFYLSREAGDVHIYNSVIRMDNIPRGDEPIEISADAIEVIDEDASEDEPLLDMGMSFESQPELDFGFGEEANTDDLEEFELDFGSEKENRLKVVKSLSEEALEQLESVDAKTLRQSLDMMNLKRSSAVRLAVTRIFRSATDVPELEKTIREEAKKIVSAEDRAELQDIKELSVNGFLDPVIDLLWQEVFS